MSLGVAPDIPSDEGCDSDVGEAPRSARGPCGALDRRPAACRARGQVANALTAILLHAEAICRRSAGHDAVVAEIVESARQIAANAGRVWTALDGAMPATSADGAAAGDD